MSQRRKATSRGKPKDSDQFAVAQPTAMDVLDKLSTRRKTYDRVEYVPQPRKRKQRAGDDDDSSVPVSPYRTTSTEAVDTEEGQEITKFIKDRTY